MGKFHLLIGSLFFFCFCFCHGDSSIASRTQSSSDGSESWGYVEVRPKAHMFWWLYKSPSRAEDPNRPWPVILWLQGGPGASGVGIGNFEEVGPLDINLEPRNSTWLKKADLLFVDCPVGTGYSYVEDTKQLVKTDWEAGTDLTTLLIEVFNGSNASLHRSSPLYIVAESYGGKFAVTLGLLALEAIEAGRLKTVLGGVALGDTWISPEDFVFSWGALLKDMSRLDENRFEQANSLALKIKQKLEAGEFEEATDLWSELENRISADSNHVDFYNFMLDSDMDPLSVAASQQALALKRYSAYLEPRRSSPGGDGRLSTLMNGAIKNKLGIIPANVNWGEQSDNVFENMYGDFMKPRINEVDRLLAKGVNVTVYSGQLDLICATKGTEAWIKKLKWEGLKEFLSLGRSPIHCGGDKTTRGFFKSYRNLHFYWILGAGHYVPVDQPCVALDMVGNITQSLASSR
ncbi:hypothetical protein DM860_000206 [Cuscuta australis]|uniref:Carboxypeptidase n=1 Tax=Cuscuta australis TaxID=267555 RepID=A0A328CVX2_9ASTE|nr:hypothetical protein DM860_000206 [Cuscuta australis]